MPNKEQEMKCPHDSAQRAFVDLPMSPHTMDRLIFNKVTPYLQGGGIEQCNSKIRAVSKNPTIYDDSGSEEKNGDLSTSLSI